MKNRFFICALVFLGLTFASFADSITVKGDGVASSDPDQAGLTFKVTTKSKEAMKAQEENATIMKKITSGLRKKYSLHDKDIVTSSYNLIPRFTYPRDKAPEFSGMEIQNEVAIKIANLANVSAIINFLTDSGVTEIYNIRFSTSKEEKLKVMALELAYENALSKAKALALKANKKIGDVKEIKEGAYSTPAPRPMHFEAKAMSAAPVIEGGSVGISAAVEVTFDIK